MDVLLSADSLVEAKRLERLLEAMEADDQEASGRCWLEFDQIFAFCLDGSGHDRCPGVGDAVAWCVIKGKRKALAGILEAGASPEGVFSLDSRYGGDPETFQSVTLAALKNDAKTMGLLLDAGYPAEGIWDLGIYEVQKKNRYSFDDSKEKRVTWIPRPFSRPLLAAVAACAPDCLEELESRGLLDQAGAIGFLKQDGIETGADRFGDKVELVPVNSLPWKTVGPLSLMGSFLESGVAGKILAANEQRPRSAMPSGSPWANIPRLSKPAGGGRRGISAADMVARGMGPSTDPEARTAPSKLIKAWESGGGSTWKNERLGSSFVCGGREKRRPSSGNQVERIMGTLAFVFAKLPEFTPSGVTGIAKKLMDNLRWHSMSFVEGAWKPDVCAGIAALAVAHGAPADEMAKFLTKKLKDISSNGLADDIPEGDAMVAKLEEWSMSLVVGPAMKTTAGPKPKVMKP